MYLQITNTTKSKYNSIRIESTSKTIGTNVIQSIKKQGWNVSDCTVSEVRDELVNTVYRGVDGKSIPPGKRQYKSRAVSRGTLNKKPSQIPIAVAT